MPVVHLKVRYFTLAIIDCLQIEVSLVWLLCMTLLMNALFRGRHYGSIVVKNMQLSERRKQ